MLGILITLLATALGLLVVDIIFPGVDLTTFSSAVVGAMAVGGVNAFIRPVLSLLSLPLTILSLGAFSIVLNGLCFWLAALLVPGFKVSGILSFLLGPIVLSVISTFLNHYLQDKFPALGGSSITKTEPNLDAE